MNDLVIVFLAGFVASGVDGALGMGFGPTSSAVLLGSGLSPATVSATVNVAKIGSGLAAAVAHWRFDNIDRRLTVALAGPGLVGALVGVFVLSNVDGDALRPMLAVLLTVVGLRVLWRFGRMTPTAAGHDEDTAANPPAASWSTVAVGAAGGCTNGLIGAWGPVVTPYLINRGVPPRLAIGSVNTAEVAVAVVAAGAIIGSGTSALELGTTAAMLAGGVLSAPLAAWSVRRIRPRTAGLALATMLLLTQARELASATGLAEARWIIYAAIVATVALIARPMRQRQPRVLAHAGEVALAADLRS